VNYAKFQGVEISIEGKESQQGRFAGQNLG